jgi:hypothetical protein
MKYAIKVSTPDGDIFVSEGPVDDMRVWTTEVFEEAERYKNFWIREGYEGNIDIVEYQP